MKPLVLAFSVAAAPAFATPPQVVAVSETVVGMDSAHLYVLRVLDDNMGFHASSQKDILLIARSLDSNEDTDIWPVLRTHDMGADGGSARLEVLPLVDRSDAFEILADRGARPLLGDGWPADHAFAEAGGLRIVDRDTEFALDWASVGTALSESLARTRSALPPVKTEGEDVLLAADFDPPADCQVEGGRLFEDGTPEDFARVRAVAMLACQNDNSMAPVRMVLVLPPV